MVVRDRVNAHIVAICREDQHGFDRARGVVAECTAGWDGSRPDGLLFITCAGPSGRRPEITITVKNHAFDPAQIEVPAGKPVVLRIKNLDASPMEFESKSLRVEKVLSGNGEAVINLRPQKPGRYEFFDDFHAATTKGVVVVK